MEINTMMHKLDDKAIIRIPTMAMEIKKMNIKAIWKKRAAWLSSFFAK